MAYNRETVAAVKERADIVQVVGERVHLTPSGADFVGLCPFHGEKTPSFRVSPSRRMYHCFGCGAGGSAIDFVMASENLEFGAAVEALAERFGVAVGKGAAMAQPLSAGTAEGRAPKPKAKPKGAPQGQGMSVGPELRMGPGMEMGPGMGPGTDQGPGEGTDQDN